jgi:hypothetical protein
MSSANNGPDEASAPGVFIEFRWEHQVTRYLLFAAGEYLFDPPPDAAQFERLVREIRYAKPPTG